MLKYTQKKVIYQKSNFQLNFFQRQHKKVNQKIYKGFINRKI